MSLKLQRWRQLMLLCCPLGERPIWYSLFVFSPFIGNHCFLCFTKKNDNSMYFSPMLCLEFMSKEEGVWSTLYLFFCSEFQWKSFLTKKTNKQKCIWIFPVPIPVSHAVYCLGHWLTVHAPSRKDGGNSGVKSLLGRSLVFAHLPGFLFCWREALKKSLLALLPECQAKRKRPIGSLSEFSDFLVYQIPLSCLHLTWKELNF